MLNKITKMCILGANFIFSASMLSAQNLQYPSTQKVQQTDTYFGTKVDDPYRWLEASDAPETAQWIKSQNKVTFDYLEKIPFRQKIRERLEKVWNYPKIGAPFQEGDFYYFYKNDGLQNQSILYRYPVGKTEADAEEFLNPNTLSKEGIVALGGTAFSKDQEYFAYMTSKGGSDWQKIEIMHTKSKKRLADKVEWVKFSGISWYKNGFFYSKYDPPAEGKMLEAKNEYHKIYYHTLGEAQSEDVLIFENKEKPLRNFGARVTQDEKYLLIYASEGTSGDEIYVKNLETNNEFKTLVGGFNTEANIIDNIGDKFLLLTNQNAPNYKLVLADLNTSSAQWKIVIPEQKSVLQSVGLVYNRLIASYLRDANSAIVVHDIDGKVLHEVKLPALGTASGFGGKKDQKEVFYSFASFTYAPTIYKYNIETNTSVLYRQAQIDFKFDDYETKQIFFKSKDGTKVPMFVVHKKGLKLDGKNPTYLYGYGGFNISLTPSFSVSLVPFLEKGGIYVMVNLRGGAEYGEEWHKNGMLLKKQNVFDDFIGAAEYLIKNKFTSKDYLAIAGGSNGGLLVGACMTQRPDLFKVALPAVGVLDMLRFHKFTIGWAWVVEYGSSERNEEEFKNLLKYSPLHNLKAGTQYPATLVKTADHDDRVVPAHSFKFISTLQEKHKGNNPVLIRIDEKAGHGAGKPTSKLIDEWADTWAFVLYNMGISF